MSRFLGSAKRASNAPDFYWTWAGAGFFGTLALLYHTLGNPSEQARKARYGDDSGKSSSQDNKA